jgi:hypothetical protein
MFVLPIPQIVFNAHARLLMVV